MKTTPAMYRAEWIEAFVAFSEVDAKYAAGAGQPIAILIRPAIASHSHCSPGPLPPGAMSTVVKGLTDRAAAPGLSRTIVGRGDLCTRSDQALRRLLPPF